MLYLSSEIEQMLFKAFHILRPKSSVLLKSPLKSLPRHIFKSHSYSCAYFLKVSHASKIIQQNCLNSLIKMCPISTAIRIENLSSALISECDEELEAERVEELKKIMNFLLANGCSSKDIKEKCLTFLKSKDCSYPKFKELESMGPDIIMLLPLLSLPLTTLRLASKQARLDKDEIGFPNRIAYLSHHLELKESELVHLLVKHSALLTMKFKRLDYKMQLLKNANISPRYIVSDLWIFNYNEIQLVNRIQAALKAEVELKPWMLRCSKKFFESMLEKNSETHRILEGEDVIKYLAKMLLCNTEYVEYMMEKNKLLKSINIPKLEQILNFLFEKGYTPQEVRLFPRVFCSSVQTLSERFDEYRQVKSTLPTISQLCISSKNFQRLKNKD